MILKSGESLRYSTRYATSSQLLMRQIGAVLHKPIEKGQNNLEVKPHSLCAAILARESRAVTHTSVSHIMMWGRSLGRFPRHSTNKLPAQVPFVTEMQSSVAGICSCSAAQGNSAEKFRTGREKMRASCK